MAALLVASKDSNLQVSKLVQKWGFLADDLLETHWAERLAYWKEYYGV